MICFIVWRSEFFFFFSSSHCGKPLFVEDGWRCGLSQVCISKDSFFRDRDRNGDMGISGGYKLVFFEGMNE